MCKYRKNEYVCEAMENGSYIVLGVSDQDLINVTEPLILTESAFFILLQFDDGPKTEKDIVDRVLSEYDVDDITAQKDTSTCLSALEKTGIIRRSE